MNFTQIIDAVKSYDPGIKSRPNIPFTTLLLELEADLQPLIRHYLGETTTSLVPIGDNFILPDDFIEARQINVDGTVVKPVSIYGSTLYEGEIGYLMTGNKIQITQSVDPFATVEMTYFARVPALTEINTTNWLSERFPGVYIHGLLARVYRYLQNPQAEQAAEVSMNKALTSLDLDHRRYSRGGNQIVMGEVYL